MSRTIFVLNGPNLNMLGVREPDIYGHETLADVKARCEKRAAALGCTVDFRQSNFEGVLVEACHEARDKAAAIVINPAALTFYSIALLDALKMFNGPKAEVHISNVHQREEIYHHSLISRTAHVVICGAGTLGYELGIEAVVARLPAG
ncbi:MAG: 3-dehydroquinate dehydratase [Proteobacteria bacterium]|nr:3-dehydroquinate dehydratase [Pseudomonadota bacterium]